MFIQLRPCYVPKLRVSVAMLLLAQAWSLPTIAQTSSIEIGLGHSSADSYQLGQYTGITQRGGFAVGGFSLQSQADDANNRYWSVSGKNLGLESGSLAASYGRWGSFSVSANYDQLPHYRFNDGRTPFNGSGSTVQTLPSDWVGASSTSGFTSLFSNLKQVNIDKNRERFTGGFEWQLNQSWQLMSEYRHETKQGQQPMAAIFGSTGGNPRGSILARPVDFKTDELSFGLSYSARNTQYNIGYSAMLFSNKNKALRFDNPFNQSQWAQGANFSDGGVGQMALEPDNSSSQFSFSAAHRLGSGTRLSGSVISTRLEQDDSFLPYSSIFSATSPLPAQDLRGQVNSLVSNVNFSTRLNRRSTLRLRYNYRERDNKTPQETYQRIPGDAATQQGLISSRTRINRIYDLEREKFSADVSYRFSAKTKLSAGYEFQETDRSMLDVATTEEDMGFIKLNFTPSTISSGWLKLTRSERGASNYDGSVPFTSGHNPDYIATLVGNQLFENDPLLRRFHLSERDRDELSANLNFYPSDEVGLSLLALLADDEYPDAKVGLQQSEKRNLAADLSYSPDANWTASVYYNFDNYFNQQAGFARRGGGNPTPFYPESVRDTGNNWVMKSEDEVNTFGTGVDWKFMQDTLDLSLDASITDAKTKTDPSSTGQSFLPFPDVTTKISSISLKGNYQLQPGRELSFRYYYERYKSSDWALDGTGADTLSNIMLLGNRSPEYSAHIFVVSLSFDLE